MKRLGASLTVSYTRGPEDATVQAREAANDGGFDVVVAVGGDGTINEVANGLAGTGTEMGIIPLGTENVLAKEMGIPLRVDKACHHLITTRPHPLDLGQAGDRYFICFAGIGFDAHVAFHCCPERKQMLGQLAYVMTSLEKIWEYQGTERTVRLRVDGETFEHNFWLMLVGNIKTYGGNLRPAPLACPRDGLLDLCVLPKTDYPNTLHQVVASLTGNHLKLPGVHYCQAREIVVESYPPEMVQVDGEMAGTTPVTVRVAPKALLARF